MPKMFLQKTKANNKQQSKENGNKETTTRLLSFKRLLTCTFIQTLIRTHLRSICQSNFDNCLMRMSRDGMILQQNNNTNNKKRNTWHMKPLQKIMFKTSIILVLKS